MKKQSQLAGLCPEIRNSNIETRNELKGYLQNKANFKWTGAFDCFYR